MPERIRKRVTVSGRVQGVWFRESTRNEAERLGADGWVRNCRDGSVEAVFEGPAAAVEDLVAWCQIGPPAARVDAFTQQEEPPEDLRGFFVRH
ncbi:MAG: acylphosphatase [Myxococcota bacterium]|jgi:acylphosphatase|nr:acylphosphatase [Myxococcota bacterium]